MRALIAHIQACPVYLATLPGGSRRLEVWMAERTYGLLRPGERLEIRRKAGRAVRGYAFPLARVRLLVVPTALLETRA